MESDDVYGEELHDLTRFEGTYRLHAVARYGTTCKGQREAQWAIQVGLGIDPGRTTVVTTDLDPRPDGRQRGQVVITPRDRYGNRLGPGRGDQVDFRGGPGTTAAGVTDNGDGSYTVDTSWDRGVVEGPTVVVSQPDRPPVVLGPGTRALGRRCPRWLWWLLALLLLLLLLALVAIVWLAAS
ncbi:MAG: hypothetical protein WD472_01415 [Dehalococcoidia bacterium]